jgi:hypothetical protein
MPIFDSKGMLKGRRLRKLTPVAHALWPFIFGLASEHYARLEADYELIVEELGHLRELLGEQDETGSTPVETLERILKEFEENNLCFGYEVKGVRWLVFDKPNTLRRVYKTVEDIESPNPPEPAFTDWLKTTHGEDWSEFHPDTPTDPDIHEKRSRAGKAGASARWNYGKEMANDGTSASRNGTSATGVRCLGLGVRSKNVSESERDAIPSTEQEGANPEDATALCELVSSYSGNAIKPDWAKYARAILKVHSLDKLKPLLEWMYVESDFWGQRTFNTKNLFDHLEEGNLIKKYNAVRNLQKRRVAKAKTEALGAAASGKPEYQKDAGKFFARAKEQS